MARRGRQKKPQIHDDNIPSLKVFKNGSVTDQLVGLASQNQLGPMLGC